MESAVRFPLARPGGVFLASMGISIIAAVLYAPDPAMPANLPVFLYGMGFSFLLLFLLLIGRIVVGGRRLTLVQRVAIPASVTLELVLFVLRPRLTGPLSPADNWIAALMIVGIHFIPFAITLGPRCALLGILCIVNAALALTGWAQPAVWLSIDALLKVGFGLWILLAPSSVRQPSRI